MDTASKDGIPSQQARSQRGDALIAAGFHNGTHTGGEPSPARARPLGVRPSTGRLISPAQERRVVLRGRITRLVANCAVARLVVLASEDTRSPIVIHITSPDGSLSEVLGILSTMNGIHCPVVTFCRTEVLGPGAIVAAHGLRGYRIAAPGCRFSFRMGGAKSGPGVSPRAQSLVPLLADVLAKDARRKPEEVLEWFNGAAIFGPQEALRLGIIDAIATEPVFPKLA